MFESENGRRLISRRSLLIGGSGLLAAYAVGCGGDDEEPSVPAETSAAIATQSPSATATATAAPTPGVLRWQRIEETGRPGFLPPSRRDHSIATNGQLLFLFGGRNDSETLGDFWAFQLESNDWTEFPPAPGSLPARFGHNSVYGLVTGRLVIFGGQAGGSFFSDVWTNDLHDGWRQIEVAGPAQRYGAASALASDGRLLVSHGFTNAGRFDDTWSLDASPAWADVSPTGDRPVKRCLCRGVWDSKRNRFLMFGGQTDGTPFLGDTWVFDGAAWTEITSEPKPSPRNFYAMAETDPGRIVLFGGNTDARAPANDVWFFDSATDTWTLAQPEGEAPSARYGHDAVWVPETRRLVVFGGHDASGDLNDLWELTIPA